MENVLSSLYTWYHIRLHITITKEDMQKELRNLNLPYLAAHERDAARPHWQILLGYAKTTEDLRTWVKKTFDVKNQTMYSISKKKTTLKKLKTYLLKEGDYFYNGFSDDEIVQLSKLCFKKSNNAQWYELDDKFLTTDMTWEDYIEEYDNLKLECRQTGNDNVMLRRLDMLMRRRDEKYRKQRRSKMKLEFRTYFLDPT